MVNVVQKKTYTAEVEARLDVARRLFAKYDSDKNGTLDANEVTGVITETFSQLGV